LKIKLVVIGKTDDEYLVQGCDKFLNRVKKYCSFEYVVLPDVKRTLPIEDQKVKEAELIEKQLQTSDILFLLDEAGKQYSSIEMADFLQQMMNRSVKNLVFLIGGPYGFHQRIYDRANGKLSLSKMTFSHQMVRLIFLEQIFRAYTIIKNEPYHHV